MPVFPDVGSTIVPFGLQLAGRLGGIDHADRDAILDRTARVEVLDLGQHGR